MKKILIFLVISIKIFFAFCEDENPINFYDLSTNQTLAPPVAFDVPDSSELQFDMVNVNNFIRLPGIGQVCSCESSKCGCCAGLHLKDFNIRQKSKIS